MHSKFQRSLGVKYLNTHLPLGGKEIGFIRLCLSDRQADEPSGGRVFPPTEVPTKGFDPPVECPKGTSPFSNFPPGRVGVVKENYAIAISCRRPLMKKK